MKFALLTIAGLLAAAAAAPLTEDQYQFLFTKYSQQFDKKYSTSEVFTKYQTFKSNVDLIVAHNAQESSFKMGINQFTDMTKAEFEQFMGFRPALSTTPEPNEKKCQAGKVAKKTTPCGNSTRSNDAFIDWDEKGKLAPVQNQGQCGSCWAFSSVAGLEAALAIKTDSPVIKLSEQMAVDCSKKNSACQGGLMENFAQDAMKGAFGPGGLCAEKDYRPYAARAGQCENDCPGVVDITDYCRMPNTRDQQTDDEAWVAQIQEGPITVGVAASSSAFQMYSSGIVNTCTDQSHNHAVVVTAYGIDNGQKYWKIRNSWGQSWGEKGSIRLSTTGTSRGGQCGLTNSGRDIVFTDLSVSK